MTSPAYNDYVVNLHNSRMYLSGSDDHCVLTTAGAKPIHFGDIELQGVAEPVNYNSAATKFYVDSAIQHFTIREPCRFVITDNEPDLTNLSTGYYIDGINGTEVEDRVLVTGQTDKKLNGVYYILNHGGGSIGLERSVEDDGEGGLQLESMPLASVFLITDGLQHKDSMWKMTLPNAAVAIVDYGVVEITIELMAQAHMRRLQSNADSTHNFEIASDIAAHTVNNIEVWTQQAGETELFDATHAGSLKQTIDASGNGILTASGSYLDSHVGAQKILRLSATGAEIRPTSAPLYTSVTSTGKLLVMSTAADLSDKSVGEFFNDGDGAVLEVKTRYGVPRIIMSSWWNNGYQGSIEVGKCGWSTCSYIAHNSTRQIKLYNDKVEMAPADSLVGTFNSTGLVMTAAKKITQNAAPTVGDDLVNKTYADSLLTPTTLSAGDSSLALTDGGTGQLDLTLDGVAALTVTPTELTVKPGGVTAAKVSGSGLWLQNTSTAADSIDAAGIRNNCTELILETNAGVGAAVAADSMLTFRTDGSTGYTARFRTEASLGGTNAGDFVWECYDNATHVNLLRLARTGLITTYGTVLPAVDNLENLGDTGKQWKNIYAVDIIVSSSILPANAACDCGDATNPWANVYTDDGLIGTSDKRLKADITRIRDGLEFVRRLQPKTYRWKRGARIHSGFIAQDFAALPGSGEWGGYCYSQQDDKHMIRLDEVIAYNTAAIQELDVRLSRVEGGAPPELKRSVAVGNSSDSEAKEADAGYTTQMASRLEQVEDELYELKKKMRRLEKLCKDL